jgi:DNA-directed RNA polymerase subunit F
MKVLLDIQDNKALHLLEVLKSLPYVKTKQLTEEKAQLMSEIREAVENLSLVRQGKLDARSAKELLDEL